ncbi:HWE histidine kinase domain-containing protein [Paracraurococcus ruber]|uniref:histidine kinase n=1 Tax=Paracraurococcus ruber TaxID=77675 RepID=A0ABS1D2N3_9PROT|nr:HWE histidine kinase domain-containing protein [Paracraurococcus ruber]MBK1660532.1 hypothetical protein [Paracraurococcus ruber]TDG30168.1 GAF domain-containing protein [Paracraurococcus ruber]
MSEPPFGAALAGDAGLPATRAFLAGGGMLGGMIRAHRWEDTPLGPPAGWPAALKTLVAVMLGARQPMFVAWGPERTMLYNDAYAPLCGARHPAALGAPFRCVWFDILDEVGPILERAFAGEPTQMDDIAFTMHRNGYPEEAHFSFSYTPVRDPAGRVEGMFCACDEITGRVQSSRRQAFRLALEARLRDLDDPRAVMAAAAEAVGRHLGCDRAGYAEVEADGAHYRIEGEWCAPGMPGLGGRRALRDHAGSVIADFCAGRTVAVEDAGVLPAERAAAAAVYRAIGARALLTVPLVKEGRLAAALFAHARAPRRWTPEEQRLVQEVAERTSSAVGRARAEAALRASEARWRGLFRNMHEGVALCEILRDGAGRPADLRFLEVNAAWAGLTGIPAARVLGRRLTDAIPGIEPFWAETFGRAVDSGMPVHAEYRAAPLGRWFEVIAYRTEPERFAVLFLDVTERKLAEERQALLAREVDHRAKNALTVVQSVLRLTRAPDLPSYVRAVEGRVAALARAQSLLAADRWQGADLRTLLLAELGPFLGGQRLVLDGPLVPLPPLAAQPLAMAVHELATNAVKHGALSAAAGRLAVRWSLRPGTPPELALRWEERGGPPVPGPPARPGFGSRVLEGTVRSQLGGRVALAWETAGLACDLVLPLPGVAA